MRKHSEKCDVEDMVTYKLLYLIENADPNFLVFDSQKYFKFYVLV